MTAQTVSFPPDDSDFEEHEITEVRPYDTGGYEIRRGPWCLMVQSCPFEPKAGMLGRFYGKGRVRGLFLDGRKVYYRTAAEDSEQSEIELYGRDVADWLDRWDSGRTVWSIEMGGLGPGYEQCIHITCAEIVREILTGGYDREKWYGDGEPYKSAWQHDREEIDKKVTALPVIKKLGLSGAQWGAAMNVAWFLVRYGPRGMMKDERVKDRHIQVSKSFP